MSTTVSEPIITWEKLPDDFPLPDDPVDNINQQLLAAALTESLELAGRIQPSMLIGINFGICATLDGKLVVKAPDWFYVRSVLPTQPPNQNGRSFTYHNIFSNKYGTKLKKILPTPKVKIVVGTIYHTRQV